MPLQFLSAECLLGSTTANKITWWSPDRIVHVLKGDIPSGKRLHSRKSAFWIGKYGKLTPNGLFSIYTTVTNYQRVWSTPPMVISLGTSGKLGWLSAREKPRFGWIMWLSHLLQPCDVPGQSDRASIFWFKRHAQMWNVVFLWWLFYKNIDLLNLYVRIHEIYLIVLIFLSLFKPSKRT